MSKRAGKAELPKRKKLSIIEGALAKRRKLFGDDEVFDPVRFVENFVVKDVSRFDVDYFDEHEELVRNSELQAFVEFDDFCTLVVRSEVMDRACRGDNEARFIVSHEVGHVYQHRHKAWKRWQDTEQSVILGRHSVKSKYQYLQLPEWELEANLFGGVLLAPPTGISPLMTSREIRFKYRCSELVATQARIDAALWRKLNPS